MNTYGVKDLDANLIKNSVWQSTVKGVVTEIARFSLTLLIILSVALLLGMW